jgi:hypothetical protein
MEQDQEELIGLIFGDDPPDNWKDNPEFALYLSELGGYSVERISSEPERVAGELHQLQQQTRDLAASNYKTFIQTSHCSKEIFQEFATTEQHLENLIQKLPDFTEKCTQFQTTAGDISRHRRLTSLTLAKHTSLLEVLELPQLMETVVRNQHYEEALQLHSYVSKLCKKQPQVKILEDITTAVTASMKLMLQQLLGQLRAPVQLPQCLKVISFLRRMDVFGETELRLKFLQARESWLNSVVAGVPKDDPYLHLTRTMEVLRVHLFDIVTQYRSIFSDDTDHLIGVASSDNSFDNRLLFTSWLSKKVQEFLNILATDLESGINSFESILGQAMYFGLSFSRIGFDFRPLLAPIFLKAIEKQFIAKLDSQTALKNVSESLAVLDFSRLPTSPPPLPYSVESASPPLSLLDYPPLAHATNAVLAALNEIRLVCPLSLASLVTETIQALLSSLTNNLLDYQSTVRTGWADSHNLGFAQLCVATQNIFLPYLQTALSALFPPSQLHSVTGLARQELASKGVGFIDKEKIMKPLTPFIPVVEPIVVESKPVETDYVKERMGEIAVALDGTETSDHDTVDPKPIPEEVEGVSVVSDEVSTTNDEIVENENSAKEVESNSTDVSTATAELGKN